MFWNQADPQRKADERRAFMTDLSLLGGLIIAAVDTEGKPSLGWRGRRAARKVSEAVTAALPVGAASGGALADSAFAEKLGHGLHAARERGAELADVARERAPEIAEAARERAAGLRRDRPRTGTRDRGGCPRTRRRTGRRRTRTRTRSSPTQRGDAPRDWQTWHANAHPNSPRQRETGPKPLATGRATWPDTTRKESKKQAKKQRRRRN